MPARPIPTAQEGDPEIPTHIAVRKATALSANAAEELKTEEYLDDSGKRRINPGLAEYNAKRRKGKMAKITASAVSEPLKGLTAAQIMEIRGREYPGQPAKNGMLGDRDPIFYRWIWTKHPKDAAIRYYGRELPNL